MYKPQKNQIVKFTIPIYYIKAICFINCDRNFVYDSAVGLFGEDKAEKIAAAQSSMIYTDAKNLRMYHVIVMSTKVEASHFYSILQHEIFHMAAHAMKTRGLKLTESSNEAYAYLIGNITQKIITKIK